MATYYILIKENVVENKGLHIRNTKLAKNSRKAHTVKKEQKGVCQFVDVKWKAIKKVNGKYRCVGEHKDHGLQVENKVYLPEGSFKLINSKNFKITRVYEGIPEWANNFLIKKYESNTQVIGDSSNE